MNRREFHRSMIGLSGLAFVRDPWSWFDTPRVNGARLNEHIAALARIGGAHGDVGAQRVGYTDFDRQGRDYVMDLMRNAGLEVHIDHAANLVGRRAGKKAALKPLVLGSHIDTVPAGGNYDGVVGSMGAIEVIQTLSEKNVRTNHPLELIIFQNEEGGTTGSRILAGEFPAETLNQKSQSGKTFGEGIRFLGGNPERLSEVIRKPGDVAAYLELHIEQGGLLDAEKIQIGVVEGIVGIRRWEVTVEGFANHAGTTPMNQRRDALLGAARMIDEVNRIALSIPGRHVATVGRIAVEPGAPNVIPGIVRFTIEVRDLDASRIDELERRIKAGAAQVAQASNVTMTLGPSSYSDDPAPTDARLRDIIEREAKALGFSTKRLPSGAGHDARPFARLGPMGMIFVPSIAGISHSPKEFSRPEDITRGADVLLRTLLALDA
jgi:beta-ureidopropionase / N-carbamoyl-L-amino-acid hydrolase